MTEAATIAEIRALFARHLPGHEVRSVSLLGSGLENIAYDVDGLFIARVSRAAARERAAVVTREARILDRVALASTLPVPSVMFADEDAGVLVYLRVAGGPLLTSPRRRHDLGAVLGEFLGAVHGLDGMDAITPRETFSMGEWLADAEGEYRVVAASLTTAERARIEAFLAAPPPPPTDRETFCHNDLGAEHILADGDGHVTGVIDWSDAAMTDPAYDWGLVFRDLGPRVFADGLRHYRHTFDDADIARAVFYARCALIEDFAYGIRDGRAAYLAAARHHFAHVFHSEL
ncbi:MAG: aminoglycoside phosphotransferase [Frankiales bacterium]|nr:aminoglycoside phosphotransferase [Frankiales bacterium]